MVKHSPGYRFSQCTSASVSGFVIVAVSLEVGRGLLYFLPRATGIYTVLPELMEIFFAKTNSEVKLFQSLKVFMGVVYQAIQADLNQN